MKQKKSYHDDPQQQAEKMFEEVMDRWEKMVAQREVHESLYIDAFRKAVEDGEMQMKDIDEVFDNSANIIDGYFEDTIKTIKEEIKELIELKKNQKDTAKAVDQLKVGSDDSSSSEKTNFSSDEDDDKKVIMARIYNNHVVGYYLNKQE